KLPVENAFTSASMSWPLMEILSGVAFSRNCVRDTGQEVLGGIGLHSHQKSGAGATLGPVRFAANLVLFLAASGPKSVGNNHGGGGDDGGGNDSAIDPVDGNAPGCGSLTATLRDFQSAHPDFEKALGDDRGLVRADLGADNKPVYAPAGATTTVSGQAS